MRDDEPAMPYDVALAYERLKWERLDHASDAANDRAHARRISGLEAKHDAIGAAWTPGAPRFAARRDLVELEHEITRLGDQVHAHGLRMRELALAKRSVFARAWASVRRWLARGRFPRARIVR